MTHLVDVTTRRPLARPARSWPAWAAVIALLLLVAAAVVLHSPWLSVREVEIAGAERADVAGRLAEAGIGTGAIMIWLDTGEAEAVVAADPWVLRVRATRVWPDRLVVEVEERTPAAWVEAGGEWLLVSADGAILESAPAPGDGLLKVAIGMDGAATGTTPEAPLWDEVVELSGVLSAPLASSSTLESRGGELWLQTPGHPVRFGAAIDLADKGRVTQVMLADGLPDGSVLDVVAPRRPAVVPAGADLLESQLEGYRPVEAVPAVEGEGDGA
jgi:hypothetical protein